MRNAAIDAAGMSPCMRTRGLKFTGLRLPLGVGVFYYPNNTKYKHQRKFQSRLCYGILVGYGVEPGNDWAGAYLVIDLGEFEAMMARLGREKRKHYTPHQVGATPLAPAHCPYLGGPRTPVHPHTVPGGQLSLPMHCTCIACTHSARALGGRYFCRLK